MTHPAFNIKKLILAGGTMFAMLAVPMAVNTVTGLDLGVISAAQAAEDGGAKKGSANKGGADKGAANKGGQGKGGSASDKIFRAPVSSVDEDSDRPVWAGVKGGKSGGGGKPVGAGSKKGDLFGEMVILLRDANGVPILKDGLVQVIAYYYPTGSTTLVPLTNPDGTPVIIPRNAEGDLLPTVTVGTTTYEVYGAEVDLGRLSVGRAPDKVLTHSLTEALSKLTSGTVTLDSTGRLAVDGVTIDSPLENLALYDAYMTGKLPSTLTLPAGFNPASLLAAAADKYGTISIDTVIYMNSILGINTGTTYYDFSTVNYDRYTTWKDATATVLVKVGDVFVPTVVNLYEAVFNSTNWVDPTAVGGADDFATAADDYRAVIEFVHDNEVR